MSEHTPGYRQPLTAPSTAAPSSDRYLYDPRNPKKPIPAQRGARFPMDPRFAPPPTLAAVAPPGPPGGSGSGGPPGGPPGLMPGYRPPFPPTTASSSSSSMMPGSATAEGEEAAKILGKIVYKYEMWIIDGVDVASLFILIKYRPFYGIPYFLI